jgi:hypothetical protein
MPRADHPPRIGRVLLTLIPEAVIRRSGDRQILYRSRPWPMRSSQPVYLNAFRTRDVFAPWYLTTRSIVGGSQRMGLVKEEEK